MENSLLM
ncbi:hypothetical protein LINPERPRIM_LOCUS31536 [Linum perenne]